jgi:hypothetical protein
MRSPKPRLDGDATAAGLFLALKVPNSVRWPGACSSLSSTAKLFVLNWFSYQAAKYSLTLLELALLGRFALRRRF